MKLCFDLFYLLDTTCFGMVSPIKLKLKVSIFWYMLSHVLNLSCQDQAVSQERTVLSFKSMAGRQWWQPCWMLWGQCQACDLLNLETSPGGK